jgi:hypothetical protein
MPGVGVGCLVDKEGTDTTSSEIPFWKLTPPLCASVSSMGLLSQIPFTQTKSKLLDPDEHNEQELS